MCLHCYGCKSYIGLMPCFGVEISITCHCLHEGKVSCCYSWQYGHLMLVLWLHEFCGKLERKSCKWSSVKAGLQRNVWQQVFLACIAPHTASMYQQMLLHVRVLVTPFNPCSITWWIISSQAQLVDLKSELTETQAEKAVLEKEVHDQLLQLHAVQLQLHAKTGQNVDSGAIKAKLVSMATWTWNSSSPGCSSSLGSVS